MLEKLNLKVLIGVCIGLIGIVSIFFSLQSELTGHWFAVNRATMLVKFNNEVELVLDSEHLYETAILNHITPVENEKNIYSFDSNMVKMEVRFESLDNMIRKFKAEDLNITTLEDMKKEMKVSIQEALNLTDEEVENILDKVTEKNGKITWLLEEDDITKLNGIYAHFGVRQTEELKEFLSSITIQKIDEDTLEIISAEGESVNFGKLK